MVPERWSRRIARSRPGLLTLIGLAVLVAWPAAAQEGDSPVGPPALEFSFSNPGARALGFGGAFVALADDATAAFANPAGLVQLVEPEVSIELRSWSFRTPFTASGRFQGEPSGVGIDTVRGVRTSESADTLRGVSFLSYVRPAGRWSLALYRHQLANFESHTATNGLFGGGSACCPTRALDVLESTDLEIASYGVAAAHRLSDRLSFGLGVQLHRTSLAISTRTFEPADDSVAGFFGPNPYLADREVARIDYGLSDSSDLGLSAGLLWKGRQWRFGSVYRRGPRTTFEGTATAGPANDVGVPSGTVLERSEARITFPAVLGMGAAFQTRDGRLTLGVEWDRVSYGSILESAGRSESVDVSALSLDDADELHLGAEYLFLASDPLIALRAGLWHDPNHRAIYTGGAPYGRAILPARDDHLHGAIGLGLVFQKAQLDLGADLSDVLDTISVSVIRTF